MTADHVRQLIVDAESMQQRLDEMKRKVDAAYAGWPAKPLRVNLHNSFTAGVGLGLGFMVASVVPSIILLMLLGLLTL